MTTVGERIVLTGDSKKKWTVRAQTENFTVLTRQADFKPKGTLSYTVIDWRKKIRGPANTIGQGWNVDTDDQCLELCQLMEAGQREVSHRNNVELDLPALV
ncbi:hypothetical protein [Rhodococcus sp. NPDC060176]|uniref:hypothetical protein n=1 Tax=Rhodococcus sp. NPDC060176 TaxID=3347062 RepID=UPI00365387A2